jgi:hypothetical protein
MSAKVFAFSGTLWTDRTDFYPQPQTYAALYPSVTPFLSAAQARYNPNSVLLPAPDFKFFEHRAGWRYQYFSYNDASPATWASNGEPGDTLSGAVTVDGVAGFTMDSSMVGAVCEVWDSTETTYKGVVQISAVASTTSVTMKSMGKPDHASEYVSALADNDKFYVITTWHGEETEAPEAGNDELEVVWNSCALQRTSVEIGQTLQNAVLKGESNELARLREFKANEHKIKMARGFYFGHRAGGIGGVAHGAGGGTDSTFVNHGTDANSKSVRATMGIFPAMRRYGRTSGDQQNVFEHQEATMSYNDFVEITEKMFQYSPSGGVKDLYCGPGFVTFLAKAGSEGLVGKLNNTRTVLKMGDPQETRIGLTFQYVDTPHGTLRVIKDPLLRGTPYANHALCVDPDNAELVRYEQDSYTTNIKTDNNPRVIKDEFQSFCGIKMTLMESHAWIKLT